MLVGHFSVPDGVEVGVPAVEEDVDAISAALASFGVEGLVDVADEVEEELEGFVLLMLREAAIYDAGGLGQMY